MVDPRFEGPERRKGCYTAPEDASLTDPILRSLTPSRKWAPSLWFVINDYLRSLVHSHRAFT